MQPQKKERNPRYLYNGQQLTLTEIAKASSSDRNVLRDRLARGMSIEAAIAQPLTTTKQQARNARARSPWRNQILFSTKKQAAL